MTTKFQITNWLSETEINTLNELIKVSKVSVDLNIINKIEKNKYLSAKSKSELYDYAKSKDIEIEKLKKEIEELKKEKKSGLGSISPDNSIVVKLKENIVKLRKENEKLKEEKKSWGCDGVFSEEDIEEEIERLREKNEDLEKENEQIECRWRDTCDNLKKEIKELEKENEKLNTRIQRRDKRLSEYKKKSKSPEKKISHPEIDSETGIQF